MKRIYNIGLVLVLSALTLSSCIKETFPLGGGVTSEQLAESASALDAAMIGIPAQLSQGYLVYGGQVTEVDMGYPGLMINFSSQLGDAWVQGPEAGYDWFRFYNTQEGGLNSTQVRVYVPWRSMYMFIKSSNDIIAATSTVENPSPVQAGYEGMARAYRAWAYWHLWNMYVPIPNIYTDIPANIQNLTVPIVTNETKEVDGKNNPRATVDEIFALIIDDLDKAEAALSEYTPSTELYPDLAVVYGLKARAYLTKGEMPKAAEYARKAIDASGATVLTSEQWHDPSTGFNSSTSQNSWMWHLAYSAESMGNLCNFVGWFGGESDWGYNSLCNFGINRWIYDRLSNTDFRKYSFLDPDKYDFYDYKTSRSKEWVESLPAYTSLKFRCGQGDWQNYAVGGATELPIMRVEEMYLIEAEALGVTDLAAGKAALEAFVQTRDANYAIPPTVTDVKSFQEEVIFHKRVEFWGEGTAFFDVKRLELGAQQAYEGTNAPGNTFKINAEGIKPGWNFVIPESEMQNNNALKDLNNPDPSGKMKPEL